MTKDEPLRELLLQYEDLSGAERARADALLRAHPEYRAVLARLRRVEQEGPLGALRDQDGEARELDPPLAAEATRSLAALKRRLNLPASIGSGESRRQPPNWLSRLLPVPARAFAVAGAVALLLVLWTRPPSPFGVVELTVPSGLRGGSKAAHPGSGTWHSGDPFALSVTLTHSARLAVLHVDPEGAVQLLYPMTATEPLAEVDAGSELMIPTPGSEIVWRFLGRPGEETFLLVAATSDRPPLPDVLDAFSGSAVEDREARIRRLLDRLHTLVGPTRRLDVQHEP